MAPFKRYKQLSELAKMQPCFYNKQEKDFKNQKVKQGAWKEIAKEPDLKNGQVVEQFWKNFRKLHSKRLTKLKEVDVSSAAAGLVNKARKALEELNYLSWFILFVKVCKTKSNLSLAKKRGD